MRSRRVVTWLATGLSVALFTSACGGSGGDDAGGAGGDASATTISVYGSEPENPLVPGNTNETGGGKIVDAMWTGLVQYDAETFEPTNAVAASIDTTDSQNYTITLNEGWTFHDGTPVTAASFVDAWNYTAYGPNAQASATFMSQIAGYEAVNPSDPDGESGPQQAPAPTAETLTGLTVVDDLTFEVALTAPFSVFPTTLGYSAFYPLPESFFADPEAFEAAPVGNGPFSFVERTPNTNVVLAAYPEYAGETQPSIGGVEYRFYADSNAAYQDVIAGSLDFIEQVPPSALTENLYQADLPDRNGAQPYLGITTMSFPLYDARWQNPQLRQAISMAIDRQAIIDSAYNGLQEPADGFVSDVAPGYVADQCGDLCTYQPEEAKQMFDAAGFEGPIQLQSNADNAINQEWMQAACVSITNALDVPCNFVPVPTFAEFLTARADRTVTDIFRTGWLGDYPSIENFLNPLFRTGASANDGEYSNPAFDELMAQADAAPSEEEGEALYQEAERILVQDMPAIPMFFPTSQFGWSERLETAELNSRRELNLFTVTTNE